MGTEVGHLTANFLEQPGGLVPGYNPPFGYALHEIASNLKISSGNGIDLTKIKMGQTNEQIVYSASQRSSASGELFIAKGVFPL
ncbi:hypothetical protein [Phaeodactylibacter xiamenensis]|uniref:hypothetical protein n=1 Tax=Phaeodactylibacter xiamenensis TaxID=1524460 RepID=UPI0024A8ACC8|nr:hypothetical protein [Phaeodactylibacter xiamenensis]